MTDADPVVKRTECPHDGCDAAGRAVVPGGVEVVATAVTSDGVGDPYDGIVYGHCPDHEFYAFYRVREDEGADSGGRRPADGSGGGSMATE
ncbi:hypothetical protein [Halosimplex sp. J119]